MLRAWKKLFRRATIRSGLVRDARGPLRNPQFVSFLAQSNRRRLDTDFQDAVLHGRKLVRRALVVLAAGGLAWVAVESARALTAF